MRKINAHQIVFAWGVLRDWPRNVAAGTTEQGAGARGAQEEAAGSGWEVT